MGAKCRRIECGASLESVEKFCMFLADPPAENHRVDVELARGEVEERPLEAAFTDIDSECGAQGAMCQVSTGWRAAKASSVRVIGV